MMRIPVAAALTALAAVPAFAQQHSLLFATRAIERTRSNTFPASLQRVERQDVMAVTPVTAPYTAEKYAPHNAWLTLAGDHDADIDHWEAVLGTAIDAHTFSLRTNVLGLRSMYDLYISTSQPVPSVIAGSHPVLRPGDVCRINELGDFVVLVREETIRTAFGIPAADPINVDAVAVQTTPVSGNVFARVFLSLENDHLMTLSCGFGPPLTTVVRDGAILAIDVFALGGPYGEEVVGTPPNSGWLVATEPEVGQMVIASGIADRFGANPTAIDDLDGLALDPAGGMFRTPTGCGAWPNLLFSGETLSGGGVLSTRWNGADYGEIAQLNGVPLGSPILTDGTQVGLRPYAFNRPDTLNGLTIDKRPSRFVTETSAPVLVGGSGVVSVDVGGATPGSAWILLSLVPGGPGVLAPSINWPNICFPRLFATFPVAPIPVAADGTGTWNFPAAWTPAFSVVFQALQFNAGGITLSTPEVIDFR